MTCRLIITLPVSHRGHEVEAVYEDVGELDVGSRAGLKALYSDARKRAAVAAGIGAYLYTSLQPAVLPIGPDDRQVQVRRRFTRRRPAGPVTHNRGVAPRAIQGADRAPSAVRRDLGEILAHGEPERGGGQGEAADATTEPATARAFWDGEAAPTTPAQAGDGGPTEATHAPTSVGDARGNGVVVVDFGGQGPDAA